MNEFMNNLIDSSVQCWGCPVFDRLFQIISDAAASVYNQFVVFCAILFCILFAFYVINAVWQNMKSDNPDPWFKKSIKPVIINSLVSLTFLSMGVFLPRFITTITFEPVADIALVYTQSMLQTNNDIVNERVTYQPMEMSDNGFFRPQLRDKIIMLIKTTITQFQSYMKMGIALMDGAFSIPALLGIGNLIKHIILFFVGFYVFYGFIKFFVRFCFYFADIIVAMAFFAFLFPLSLILAAFKGADNVPSWLSTLGKSIGTQQIKNLINAIIALAAAVLTYTVIMVIISKFFAAPGQSSAEIMTMITSGNILSSDLSFDNLEMMTIASCVVLIYVINFIYSQIPNVTKMVMESFGVGEEKALSEQLANDAMQLTKAVANTAKNIGATIISGGKSDDKKTDTDKPKDSGK